MNFVSIQIIYGQQNSDIDTNEYLGITLNDKSLSIEEYVTDLNWPTGLAFIDNDILVLEKNSGNVLLISDGELQEEPILKIDVSKGKEEGLLGILTKNSTVYLHFTTKNQDSDSISNWFYQYTWENKQLTKPTFLKEIPGGTSTHNAGPMVLHPDGTVYAVLGDLNSKKGILQNYLDGEPDDTSSIFPIDRTGPYYAIGIRNSFGLAVDPVTGNFWDTENGPNFFDEINFVPPKFNSGWASIQGPATEKQIEDLPSFNGYVYSDPEFSWENPVAVTAISFIQSKLFPEYQNSVLVGDFNNGVLYKFNLNKNRTGFVFNDSVLSDFVLNRDDNTNEIILGTGFLGITDIEEGPDGMIYIISIGNGKIYRIFPSNEQTVIEDSIRCSQTPKDNIDLSGCDLSGLNLQNKNLSYIDLSFSNLENTNFENSNLHGAILSGTDLRKTNLNGTILSDAEMNSVFLNDVNIENINFKNANLKSANLHNVKLINSDLTNTNLDHVILTNSDLYDVLLNDANLNRANFENTVFENVEIKNAYIDHASFKNAKLHIVDLDGSTIWVTDFTDAEISQTNFIKTDIYNSKFIHTNLKNIDFSNSKISYSTFLELDLSGTSLLDVYPFETSFENILITKDTKINTCLEHDLLSRAINKILREIRTGSFDFLSFVEVPLVQICKI